jgi:hypothetical protein
MTAKAAQAQAASDARLAELLAKCGPVWVPAEDQEHLHAVAAKDAFYAREDVALAYCRPATSRLRDPDDATTDRVRTYREDRP